MNIVLIVLVATVLGFLVVLLAGRGQRTSPAAPEHAPRADASELAWVRARGVEGYERILLRLFAEMGFEPERAERGDGSVDFHAVDPTPIRGGRLYVHAVLAAPGVPVDGDDVRALIDTARADSVGKAVLVTLGRFTDDARETAKDAPVELVDGEQLAALVKKHLPQAYATRTA